MFGHGDEDIKVARAAALIARLAFAGQADAHAGFHARRDLHRQLARLAHLAGTRTGVTRMRDHLAAAGTARTGPLHGEDALLGAHAANAAAITAGAEICARFRADAVAGRAGLARGNRDLRILAAKGVFQRDRHVVAQIRTALRTAAPAPGCRAAEHLSKDGIEDIGGIHAPERIATARPRSALKGGMAEPVIGRALLLIGEHGIGLVNFLELFLGFRVSCILVRMVLHRQFAIGRFQRLAVDAALNAQYFVVVAFAHTACYRRSISSSLSSGGCGAMRA